MTAPTRLWRIALALILAVAAIWAALNRDRFDPAVIEASIRSLGPWAPLAFIALYALAAAAFVPGAILTLTGGALFGPVLGFAVNLTGASLAATAAFFVARGLAADWVRRKAGPRANRLIAGVEAEGWRFVAFTRLVPIIPFGLLNYALGLTRIAPAQFILATIVFIVPGTLAYTWIGYAGRAALEGNMDAIRHGLIALALLAAVAFLPRLVRRFRREAVVAPRWIEVTDLHGALRGGADIAVIDVRGPEEFTGPLGHIAGALNVPVGDFPARMPELTPLRARPIVLVCKTDRRSAAAALILGEAGFPDVRVLRAGMVQWNADGLPIGS